MAKIASAAAGLNVPDPQHERESRKQHDPQRPLRTDAQGDGDAHQENALPVPEDDVARRVERVRDGDGGEDQSECAPGADNVGLHLAGAGDDHGRKAVEAERDVSAHVAVETPRYVPQRSAQQQAGKKKRQADQKAILTEVDEVALRVDEASGKSGEHRNERRAKFGAGVQQAVDVQQAVFNVAALHLGDGNVRHEPQALRCEDEEQDEGGNLRKAEFGEYPGRRHALFGEAPLPPEAKIVVNPTLSRKQRKGGAPKVVV